MVLANSNDPGGSALGMYLLGALDEPPAVHLLAEPGVLAAHTGTYLLEGQAARLRIAVEHGQLVAQLTGQPAVAIFPSGPDQFSYRAAPARLVFESDEGGRSQRVVLHQNGLALTFDRVTPDPSE